MFSEMSIKLITFALILLSCFCSVSLAQDTLIQGQALNSSSKLVSKNGNFTLQFGTIGTTDSNATYLGIWFSGDPGYRPYWIANRDQPIPDNSGFLAIDASGTLKLNYSGGDVVELYSTQSSNINLTAVLEDSGNFILRDTNSPSQEILWQSFDNPTDIILPGMKLGNVNGRKRSLTSWLTDSVPAMGAFTLEWNSTGNELVIMRRGTLFWSSGPITGSGSVNVFNPGSTTVDYNFTVVSNANEESVEFNIPLNEFSFLDDTNIHTGFMRYNGMLTIDDRVFAGIDICNGSNTQTGCKSWGGPTCRNNGDSFGRRRGYFGPNAPREFDTNASLSISDCMDMCWKNCSCFGIAVLTSNANDTGCSFYFGDFTVDPTGQQMEHYVIVGDEELARHGTEQRNWIWILSAAVAFLMLLLIGIFLYIRRKRQKEKLLDDLLTSDANNDTQELEVDENKGHNLKVFSVATIMDATKSFSMDNKLGQGGFGPVYKGKLSDGREIAVKRLSRSSGQGLEEFKNELILIAKLQHTNLVRLLGCCIRGAEKMLVYEYMPNKSLDTFIFDQSKKKLIDWNKRFEIIEGIAQGLLYLHKYSRLRIIHRDMKVSNILLDEHMNPKISDFGMARIFKTNESEANTNRIVGTYGYMSPEYAMEGIFSVKSDVFSFGVLVLEIISGRKNHGLFQTDPPLNLVAYAWKLWKECAALDLIDPTLRDSCSKEQVLRCINVGLLCVEDNASDRPIMSDVISMLTSKIVQLPPPKQPAFTSARSAADIEISVSQGESGSVNDMSISSTLRGR